MAKEPTREEYLKLRAERENLPGVVVVGGHVVSDRFGEKYGSGPMPDEDLPESLKTQNIDYPATEDIDFPSNTVGRRRNPKR